MRAIFGLVRLDRGEVRWTGKRVGPEERVRFGYMPEERPDGTRCNLAD
jgi:ABC-2 type transport system ATP-binding protein